MLLLLISNEEITDLKVDPVRVSKPNSSVFSVSREFSGKTQRFLLDGSVFEKEVLKKKLIFVYFRLCLCKVMSSYRLLGV